MADVDIIETRMLFEGFGGYGESKVHAGGPERLDVEFRSGAENQVRGAMDALNQMLLRTAAPKRRTRSGFRRSAGSRSNSRISRSPKSSCISGTAF